MNSVLATLGALGGLAVFATAVWAVIRAILRQVTATENNTSATDRNTTAIGALEAKVASLDTTVAIQGQRITAQETEMSRLADAVYRNGHAR